MALAFAINLVPAFMPSTWMVLAFFYIRFDLPLLPLTIGGAIVSGLGRLVLAKGTQRFRLRFMAEDADLDELGRFLDDRRQYAGLAVFFYALSPLPTNNLFIAAGLAGIRLAWVLAGFWAARILADTFWVWTTDQVFDTLGEVFEGAFGSWTAIALQTVGLISVVLLFRVPWARWLRRFTTKRAPSKTSAPP
jgi:hypothetical protein